MPSLGTVKQLASIFDEPRIAAIRPLIDRTAAGREVSARLDQLPVNLTTLTRAHVERFGATAHFDHTTNTIELPDYLLDGVAGRDRRHLASLVLHEGVHRIQLAEGTIVPTRTSLAVEGAKGAVRAIRDDRPVHEGWRSAVDSLVARAEGEAYLVDYRAAREAGQDLARHNVLHGARKLERSLGRPLVPSDLTSTLLEHPVYAAEALRGRRQARDTTAQIGVLAGAIGIGAASLALRDSSANGTTP